MVCVPPGTDWSSYKGLDELDPDLKLLAEVFAWRTLWVLTGQEIALCPDFVRPCRPTGTAGSYFTAPVGFGSGSESLGGRRGALLDPSINVDGQWVNSRCSCSASSCSCTSNATVFLPGPIGFVQEVKVDGVVISADSYEVQGRNALVRIDGQAWPLEQKLDQPDTELGTFSVTYYRGASADPLLLFAAGVLAQEFVAMHKGGKCRLPQGVKQVQRQGINMELRASFFENGQTGITEVDAIIRSYNPHANKTPVVISSPDRRRRTPQTRMGGRW